MCHSFNFISFSFLSIKTEIILLKFKNAFIEKIFKVSVYRSCRIIVIENKPLGDKKIIGKVERKQMAAIKVRKEKSNKRLRPR